MVGGALLIIKILISFLYKNYYCRYFIKMIDNKGNLY
jgi:hypothetical protein